MVERWCTGVVEGIARFATQTSGLRGELTEADIYPVWTPDGKHVATTYMAKGDSFVGNKARLWSEKRFTTTSICRKAPTHVTFRHNFFDELRRQVPAEQ